MDLSKDVGLVVSELRARHGHSAQPESMQVIAVLQAVVEVIEAEGMKPTPTTLFAACMSALERPDTRSSPPVLAAMLTVLAHTLGCVPSSVVRTKFAGAVALLSQVLGEAGDQTSVVKGAITCLGTVVAATDAGSWSAAAPAWQQLLGFLTDTRAKVRRRAVTSAVEVLAAAQGSGALLTHESEALAQLCRQVLPGPAAAARAAAAASNKQRGAAEEAIMRAVTDVLHLLGALKQLLPLMAGSTLPGVLDQLLKLYSLRQPLITRHTTDALAALAAAPGGHLAPAQLDQLVGLVLDEGSGMWDAAERAGGGADGTLALVRLLGVALRSLAERDSRAAARRLPRAVHVLASQLSARQDGVRHGAREALGDLLSDESVLSDAIIAEGATAASTRRAAGAAPSALSGIVAAVVAALGPAAADSWGLALPVASSLLRRLGEVLQAALTGQIPAAAGDDSDGEDGGASGAAAGQALAQGIALVAAPLVRQVGELYAGAFDAEEDAAGGDPLAALTGGEGDEDDSDGIQGAGRGGRGRGSSSRARSAANAARGSSGDEAHGAAAEAALGVALRWLGPESVLAALPLQLKEGIDGTAEPRTWLLPMLRRYVRGARLGYWTTALLPLARSLGGRSASAAAQNDKLIALHCHTLEAQIWAALPAFCSWPADATTAYPAAAKDWAAAFHGREDLRAPIAAALERLCRQARAAAIAAGETNLLPPGEAASGGRRQQRELDGRGGAEEPASDAADDGDSDGDLIDSDEEYGAPPGSSRRGRGRRGSEDGGGKAGETDLGVAPTWFDGPRAAAQLGALRPLARNWLPLLLNTFLASPPEARAPIGAAISAYSAIAEPELAASLFRSALSKLVKIQKDAAAELPPPDEISEGGSNPSERAAAFIEAALALCIEGPLDDGAIAALVAAAKPLVLGDSDTLLQKKGYKALASLAEHRPAWARRNLRPLLDLALRGAAASVSAAKRYRLRLLRHLILLLDPSSGVPVPPLDGLSDAPGLPGAAAIAAATSADERRSAVGSALVAELVLCTKEANTKTREAAYALLVELAHELDDARPLQLVQSDGAVPMNMDGTAASSGRLEGGLIDFFNAVLAGLVGGTPHMVSATVMAAARLLFEFSGALEGMAPQLLSTVLLLLRSPNREVVKSVLGFVKVAAMRLPADDLTEQLPAILEGLLLWSDDSKNRFRLKTRAIVERLARRCGIDAVAAACPEGDARLVSHIRKQNARKERRRGGTEAGSEAGDELETRSMGGRSAAARTARASEWGHTAIFGEEDEEDGGAPGGGRGGAASVSGRSRATAARGGAAGRLLERMGGGGAPIDLLEAGNARQLVRAAAGAAGRGAGGRGGAGGAAAPSFEVGDDGRMVIRDEEAEEAAREAKKRAKRKRAAGEEFFIDSDDSDFDDLRGYAPGIERALHGAKSVRFAPSAAGGTSIGGRSAKSAGGRSVGGASAKSSGGGGKGQQHSGDRYKPKKSGTGGDSKGGAAVEPYAYWSLDRRMLNRRRGKQAGASKKLGSLVKGAQSGALKGAKAKRSAAKRQKR